MDQARLASRVRRPDVLLEREWREALRRKPRMGGVVRARVAIVGHARIVRCPATRTERSFARTGSGSAPRSSMWHLARPTRHRRWGGVSAQSEFARRVWARADTPPRRQRRAMGRADYAITRGR